MRGKTIGRRAWRPQLSTAVSAVAIFVSLGGTATAALVLTGKSVRNGSLTGADFGSRSIAKADLARGAAGIRGESGEDGPQGMPGPEGPPGTNGTVGSAGKRGIDGPRGATVVWWAADIYSSSTGSDCGIVSGTSVYDPLHRLGPSQITGDFSPGDCMFDLGGQKWTELWGSGTPSCTPSSDYCLRSSPVQRVTIDRVDEWDGDPGPFLHVRLLDAQGDLVAGTANVVLYGLDAGQ